MKLLLVFILVMVEMLYTSSRGLGKESSVVILVIMEMLYIPLKNGVKIEEL